jgi:two-component system, LuxR family, sensor kinase FixL
MCRAQASRDAQGRPIEWFGTNTDGEERRQVEEALHKAQVDLAHLTRVTTMRELAASIAHEINQPLGAIVNNGNVCLRLLSQSSSRNDEAIEALSDMVNDANRARAIIGRIRGYCYRSISPYEPLSLASFARKRLQLRGHCRCTPAAFCLPAQCRDRESKRKGRQGE